MSQTDFEAFVMFRAIKAHMTNASYDYFKYQGKIKASLADFNRRSDKFLYNKLARQPNNQLRTAVTFLAGGNWIGDVVGQLGQDELNRHVKYIDACSRHFAADLDVILQDATLSDTLYPPNNTLPRPISLLKSNKIGIETLCILNEKYRFTKGWAVQFPHDPLVKKISLNIEKYTGFFSYKPQLIAKILVDRL